MRLIRDDAPQKIEHAKTFLILAGLTTSPEMLTQHLQRVNLILDELLGSMKETPPNAS